MRILVSVIGLLLVATFLIYMAAYLGDLPLIIVCGLGVLLAAIGFWQDEVQGDNSRRGNGRSA